MSLAYKTQVLLVGGRAGVAKSDDGQLSVSLNFPKVLGGDGRPGTNPEQLFAAAYAACFESTMGFVAAAQKIKIDSSQVRASIELHSDPAGGFILKNLRLEIEIRGISRDQAQGLVNEAKKLCPFHKLCDGKIEKEYILKE